MVLGSFVWSHTHVGKCDVVLELCVAVGLWVCRWRPSGSKSPNPYIHSVVRGPERFSGQEDGQSDKRSHHFPLPILSESEIVRVCLSSFVHWTKAHGLGLPEEAFEPGRKPFRPECGPGVPGEGRGHATTAVSGMKAHPS